MGLPKFNEIISLSNSELSKKIVEIENQLFTIRFKKATRQNFKSHEIKVAKRQLKQLKTLLTLRLQDVEQKGNNFINQLIN